MNRVYNILFSAEGRHLYRYFADAGDPDQQYQSPQAIRSDILDSIELHLRADVPVGISLSGGIDSSLIAGVLASQQKQLHSFSAIFPEYHDYDESGYIYSTLQKYKHFIHGVFVSPSSQQAFETLDAILYAMDEPYRSIGMILPYHIFQHARQQGIKVMLCGQGGDELFGGYSNQRQEYYLELLYTLQWGRFFKEYPRHALNMEFLKKLVRSWLNKHQCLKQTLKQWLMPQQPKLFNLREMSYFEELNTQQDLNTRTFFFKVGLRDFLSNEDRMSMAHSVESRVPLLNSTIYRKIITKPYQELFRQGISKYWLREAFKDVLTQEVYSRQDKMGYLSPQKIWLEQLLPPIHQEIQHCTLFSDDSEKIQQLMSMNDDKVWRVFIVAKWYNTYIETSSKKTCAF